jgi:hypothetical protein
MTLRVHTAEQIRRAGLFTGLIEPMRAALQANSGGQAQQTMSTIWPADKREDG